MARGGCQDSEICAGPDCGCGCRWPGRAGAGLAASFMCCFLLLQAWAVFKGKFKEGDKAEPATWKTRLRCALNKSPDFEEVTDRSQLDISEPYKVYRIVPEEEQKCNYPGRARGPAEAARPAAPPPESQGAGWGDVWASRCGSAHCPLACASRS